MEGVVSITLTRADGEAVIAFAQKQIPFGPDYDECAPAMRDLIAAGKEIYRLD